MREQYAAINDLESVAAAVMKLGTGRIAFVFDPKLGWCVTDEIQVTPAEPGREKAEFKVTTYRDWYRPHVANALSAFGAVRFLGASAMDKLFRKPMSTKQSQVGGPAGAQPADSKKGGTAPAPAKPATVGASTKAVPTKSAGPSVPDSRQGPAPRTQGR
ncbi:hypothetical protein [Ottowia sp.]|uniref:hypothetical protein n=1 Tax=Ottowia sp. TaxID=1898956 RepID=UPI0025E8B7C6|nr:hypothetical protein [Ottowia sp.]MBK6616671.1 hypothetical protein [Ottowia sp.]